MLEMLLWFVLLWLLEVCYRWDERRKRTKNHDWQYNGGKWKD